jgi:hypothetical protein
VVNIPPRSIVKFKYFGVKLLIMFDRIENETALLLKTYLKELLEALKKKKGIVFPLPDIPLRLQIILLERFIHYNRFFDTKEIWKKYEEDYQMRTRKPTLFRGGMKVSKCI